MYTAIPFYATEIIIALFLCYVLMSVNKLKHDPKYHDPLDSVNDNVSSVVLMNNSMTMLPEDNQESFIHQKDINVSMSEEYSKFSNVQGGGLYLSRELSP